MVPFELAIMKQCVAFLYRERLEGPSLVKDPVGTCFFVINDTGTRKTNYIVTAGHVLDELRQGDGGTFVRLNRVGSGVLDAPIEDGAWIKHPDKNIDLAVYPGRPNIAAADPNATVQIGSIPLHNLRASERFAAEIDKPWPPEETEQVFFIGMMMQYQGEERMYPMVRMGHVALNTQEEIDLKPGKARYRVIESLCFFGNSGSPVWVYYQDPGHEPRYIFLGVLSTAFRAEADEFGTSKEYHFGVTAVVPDDYVGDLVRRVDWAVEMNTPPPQQDKGTALAAADVALTRKQFEEALRKVSRPDGKEVIEKRDQASS